MADLTVTPASVVAVSGGASAEGFAGEIIAAGQAVYLKASDNKYWLAQNDGTAAEAASRGIALNGAAPDQPIRVANSGQVNPGATVAVGQIYCVSATPGGICPYADVSAGRYVTVLGVGATAALITMNISATGIVKA